MGNRLSKIYTRTGDDGSTGLGDGSRVAKNHLRVEAYGTVDELNAQIGLLRAELSADHEAQAFLETVQHDLFDLGGELCIPGYTLLKPECVAETETAIDQINANLPPLKDFILPGGSKAAAVAHVARTVCRRAERRVYTLSQQEEVNEDGLKYLNRISDYLFVLARVLARENGGKEVLWRQRNAPRHPEA
ncbi:MAG: cob(I)yrinic acid a,c-diamide adenosyltransferase [Moraxellaceae bacterium]|jgi:cob(I)alamin adenosyltransferase|nr:cob(I)yrinic acid a,c-diamide adenosyltransferase [Moraxellaceae bacterium]MBP7230220.1 cob(I)yrinic acid a,c-diamide adenosyltransferase [Moraxellaceae bacterium]MBP8853046.1 cob(I)yrinic acid a,c-diamide adenosyltransferase [Moraxellaceae bacterium]MBP9046446.1 cob(I)yrinic acid a,c-diamide adenosyltransferase [Moraxellaceae bacterium]MBP9730984.1 cob(I)yrinic acid a,c-diamide adenosyltransferase [Moraxellaceae bacterium]